MKRWVVILLVLLAVIVLVSPGIVGRLAEQNLQTSIDWAASENDTIAVTEQKFDRRWFTSEGRYRIEFRNGRLQASVADPGSPGPHNFPALIVATHIDHGLIPVTSLSRDAGSLKPGLASAVSTLQFDPGNGELIEIPGKVLSQVGLSGETVSQLLLEAGSLDNESIQAQWSGADVTVATDPTDLSMRFEGTIEPVSIATQDKLVRVQKMRFKGEQVQTEYGFGVGSIECAVEAIAFGEPDADGPVIGKLTLQANSAIDGDRVNGSTVVNFYDVVMPGFGAVDMALDLAVNRLDARSGEAVSKALQEMQGTEDPDAALADLYPRIAPDLQGLLAAGAEVRIDRFDVVLPQGTVTSKARFDLPETDKAKFSWPALLLALTASADLRVPATLMEMAQATHPQADSLVALGILKKDGDFFAVEAEYAKGLLTVNGAPMPIPLPVQ